MRIVPLISDKIYHLCNRSTEGIPIFETPDNACRFLKVLSMFNTTGEGLRGAIRHPQKQERGNPLVEVFAVALMPNHFHLLVKQLKEEGISRWMHRCCNSFSHSFNLINNRKGVVFMGKFKAIPVLEDEQLFHLFVYIHANPLDLVFPQWRDGHIKNWLEMKNFLKNYRFSSLGLYNSGFKVAEEVKTLVNADSLRKFLSEWSSIEEGIKSWSTRNFEEMGELSLE